MWPACRRGGRFVNYFFLDKKVPNRVRPLTENQENLIRNFPRPAHGNSLSFRWDGEGATRNSRNMEHGKRNEYTASLRVMCVGFAVARSNLAEVLYFILDNKGSNRVRPLTEIKKIRSEPSHRQLPGTADFRACARGCSRFV